MAPLGGQDGRHSIFSDRRNGARSLPRHELANDANVAADGHGFNGVTLAYNTRSREEVDAVLQEAATAGARILKPAQEAFWGGYSGYFSDPDGFLWEVAWNPFFPIAGDGRIRIPD